MGHLLLSSFPHTRKLYEILVGIYVPIPLYYAGKNPLIASIDASWKPM